MKSFDESSEIQKKMNARLWRAIEDNTFCIGAQAISKATGMSPQTLYNIRDNKSFPATGTIIAIRNVVPSLSIDAIYSESDSLAWTASEEPEPTPPAAPVAVKPVSVAVFDISKDPDYVRLLTENKHLERMIEKQERELDESKELVRQLLRQSSWLMRQPIIDHDEEAPVKQLASNQAAAPLHSDYRVHGLRRYDNKLTVVHGGRMNQVGLLAKRV